MPPLLRITTVSISYLMCILARTPHGEIDDCSTLRMSTQRLAGPSKVFGLVAPVKCPAEMLQYRFAQFSQAISATGGRQLRVCMYAWQHQGHAYDAWPHTPLMSSGTSLRRKDIVGTRKRGE
ncbi:hypothetical protein EDD17DRAFT_95866 [Pisolithus thermaeus]|nr:hypothetical protein EDD17DRAFT_95866 [Pisolithus thermaeus]